MNAPVADAVQGFPPVLPAAPRVLILGSMPSARSLAEQQYYGHPRNRFWPLMGRLLGAGPELDYAPRLERLRRRGVALWDVLAACRRAGSLDTAIERESEIPNPIAELLAATPSIRAVCCNGRAAAAALQRHGQWPELPAPPALHRLPSTSPANAAWSLEGLAARWGVVVDALDPP